jgi:predicted nuclease with TOPRIM domain
MERIQEVFNKIEEIKKEQREIKKSYRDALSNSQEYQGVIEKLNTLKERKKQIEEDVKDDFGGEFTRLEDLKIDLEAEKEMLSDIALNKLVKGEKLEIKDKYDNQYEPIFSVKFKKLG